MVLDIASANNNVRFGHRLEHFYRCPPCSGTEMDALVPVVVDTLEFSVDIRAYDVDFLIFCLVPVNTKAEYYAYILFFNVGTE